MPSRFEPCGLNQMYSLRYGTIPIVRNVGGLADSVVNVTPDNLDNGTATGFVFDDYNSTSLAETIERAVELYRQPQVWEKVVRNGMSLDWSWSVSARNYLDTYRKAVERKHARAAESRM